MNCKRFVSMLLCVAMFFSMAQLSFAAESEFSKKPVDSNSWSFVLGATKAKKGSTAALKITKIYDADGNNSSYTHVKAKASKDGTSTKVKKGKWVDLTIPSKYRAKGSSVSLYCMGNDPSLDCKISGCWNVH